ETYDFVLLMEDMGDVSPVDQLVGSTEAEAFDKIEKIAKLHAMWWGKCKDPENSWIYDFMSPDEMTKLRDFVYTPSLEPAIANFTSFFGTDGAALCRKVGEQYTEIVDKVTPTSTFLHGDYRQDNFIIRAGSDEPVIMDWQISGAGFAVFDVTYFICQSLQTDLRQNIQRPLIERYVACLKENGVTDYTFEQAWNDYRILILFCLIYPITVCGSLDLSNDRGKALAECMLERNLSAVEDLNAGEFLR
ncbi:MAG TPA: phosphotransferase, partial [Pseudomonadales bacterium]|nr:phosphotransferase [Pseudomonadales bacterium]